MIMIAIEYLMSALLILLVGPMACLAVFLVSMLFFELWFTCVRGIVSLVTGLDITDYGPLWRFK